MEGYDRKIERERDGTGIGVCPLCNSVVYDFHRRVIDYASEKSQKQIIWHLRCWAIAAERTRKAQGKKYVAENWECIYPREEDQPSGALFALDAKE